MTSSQNSKDTPLANIEYSISLVLSLISSIIAFIWIFAIIVKKLGIRRRQVNLIKFGPGNNFYYDVTNIIGELRIQSKIFSFSLLIVFIEVCMIILFVINNTVLLSCHTEDFQTNNTSCYIKYGLDSPIVACRIHPFLFVTTGVFMLLDVAIFGLGLFYIKSLIERAKSPLKSKWKHIAILTCSILSFAIISTNPYTLLLSPVINAVLLQVFLIYAMVGARTLYRQLTKQQRDLVHFNRSDRYKIIQSIERIQKRYKLILLIISSSVQVSVTAFNVFAISRLIQEIFVDNCQFEYNFHTHLPFIMTAQTKSIINNLVNYSTLFSNVSISLVVINIILLNIIYCAQTLINYFCKSRKRVYRYNMHNLFNPKLDQPLLQDYVRANRTCITD